MNNGEYWRKRSEIREARAYSNCLEATNGLVNAYRDTAANIRREINDFYNRFATENGMDYADAVKFLNREEALEWRTSVEGYIEEIRREKDPSVRERLMQEYDARAYGSRITRLESLNGSIDTELSRLYARANEQFRQLLGENYTDGYYQAIYDIQSRYGYSSAFATVNSKVVENALTYPWSGANFSDRLWKHKFELLNQLRETLTTGLIRGESVQDMSKRLAERMNVSRSNALRLIRTESSHIHNTAELDAYKACGFEEYEYMASFGERTCDVCGGLDGRRFKLGDKQFGVNFPPLHPNCRCTTVAVDPDDDLEDVKSGELDYEQWYRKYVGGRAPEKLEYREGTETAVPRGQPVPVMPGGARNSAGQLLTTRGESGIIKARDNQFLDDLRNGKINTAIDDGAQKKHYDLKAWRNQVKQALKNFRDGLKGRSAVPAALLKQNLNPQELVNKYAGTGKLRWLNDKPGTLPDEFVTVDYPVGITFERETGRFVSTNVLQIRYTKNGTHVFPTKPKGGGHSD